MQDLEGVTCTECSFGWVFNLVGTCISVSDQCKTYDAANGECLTCYNGYSVVNGSCLYNNESPAQGGCKDWSWAAKTCNACADNWVLLNGLCVAVSDQCRTHDANGWCTACYRGYDLTGHKNDNGTVVSVTCDYSPSNTLAFLMLAATSGTGQPTLASNAPPTGGPTTANVLNQTPTARVLTPPTDSASAAIRDTT
jgi:hypothetical protein